MKPKNQMSLCAVAINMKIKEEELKAPPKYRKKWFGIIQILWVRFLTNDMVKYGKSIL